MTRLSAFLSALQMHLRQPWLQLRLAAAASALIAGILVYAFSHQQPRPAGMQPAQVLVMDLAPRGDFLALATEDGTLEIRRAASNRVLHQRRYAHRPVRDLALFTAPATENASAQTRLIIADAMGRLEIWEAETARTVVASSAFPDSVIQPVFAVSEGGVVWASGENEEGGWLARIAPDEAEPLIFLKEDASADGEAPTNTAPVAHGAHRLLAPGDASVVLDLPFSEPLFFSYSREPGEQSGNWYSLVPDFDVTKTHPMDGGYILVPQADALNVFHAGVTGAPEEDKPPAVTLPLTVLRPPAETIQILEGHEADVDSSAFSPDGLSIVTASADDTARVWAMDEDGSWQTQQVLEGHESSVLSAAFSSDGTRIVTGSADNTARVWEKGGDGTWRIQHVLQGHEGPVYSVSFSPDGTRIVTGSEDTTARVWERAEIGYWRTRYVLEGHYGSVLSANFSSDGTRIVTGSTDETARVREISEAGYWQKLNVLEGHEGSIYSASFSPDDTRIVTASQDGTAQVWAMGEDGKGQTEQMLEGHKGIVLEAAFSPHGTQIVTASQDMTARVWSMGEDGEWQTELYLEGHENDVNSAAFSPDGMRIVTASNDGTSRIWDVSSIFNYAALTPLDLMFLGAEGDTPTLWSATPQQGLCRHSEAAPMECARPENDYAAARYLRPHNAQSAPRALVGDASGHLALVQRGDNGELRTLASYHGHRVAITHIDSVQTASGHRAAIASADGHVQVLDLPKTGAPMVARTVHMAGNVVASGRALHTSMLDAIAPRVEGEETAVEQEPVPVTEPEPEDEEPVEDPPADDPPIFIPGAPERFSRGLEFVLRWEGGLVDDARDGNGKTNQGVIQAQYDRWRSDQGLPTQDVADITDEEVGSIYLDTYWNRVVQKWYPDDLSLVMFDTAVNMGVNRANRILQQAINETSFGGVAPDGSLSPREFLDARAIPVDGVMGERTYDALRDVIAAGQEPELLSAYLKIRRNTYNDIVERTPSSQVFLRGWLNRLNALASFVDVDIAEENSCEPQQQVVYFQIDSSAITSQAAAVLDQMVDNLGTCKPVSVFIEGRAGSGESGAYDRALGMRLARAVEDALIARGLNPEIIVTELFDGPQSSVPKRDGVREPLNRRVEVTIR